MTCPDCGKKIEVFGKSHIAEISEKFRLPVLARIPISVKLAAACDAGTVELYEGDFMQPAADAVQ